MKATVFIMSYEFEIMLKIGIIESIKNQGLISETEMKYIIEKFKKEDGRLAV